MPIAAAGAGPSSAIASTSARNEPEIRWPWWLTANRSVTSASASRIATSAGGLPVVGRGGERGDHRDRSQQTASPTIRHC